MRLFVGIRTGCEGYLSSLQREMKQIGRGRFTEPGNLHMTLKFLGEVPFSDLKGICDAVSEIKGMPFELTCEGLIVFERGRIVSARVGGETDKLADLFAQLETALEKRGFARDTREFCPHITLARNFRAADGCSLGMTACKTQRFDVSEVILFESRQDEGSLVYVPLFVHVLEGEPAES